MHAHTPALLREVHAALLKRAAALGIDGESEEAIIDGLLDREVRVEPPTEDECRNYYAGHESRFRAGALAEVDHILFAPKEAAQRSALRGFAQQKLDALHENEADFADAARRWSNCPSGTLGGQLGQVTRGDLVPEFWRAIEDFARSGLLPALVETRYGVHIVRINRFETGPVLPFEAVRRRIEAWLAQDKLVTTLRAYAHTLTHRTADGPTHGH